MKLHLAGVSKMEMTIPLTLTDSTNHAVYSLLESNIAGFNYSINGENLIFTITEEAYTEFKPFGMKYATINQSNIWYNYYTAEPLPSIYPYYNGSNIGIDSNYYHLKDIELDAFHYIWSNLTNFEDVKIKLTLEANLSYVGADIYYIKQQKSLTTLCTYQIFLEYESNDILEDQTEITLIPEIIHHCTNWGASVDGNNPNIELLDENVVYQ